MQKKGTEKLPTVSSFYSTYVVSKKRGVKNIFPVKMQNTVLQIIQNIRFSSLILEVNFGFVF